jgi:hypothetical protein
MARWLWVILPLPWIAALTYGLFARFQAIQGPGIDYVRPIWHYIPVGLSVVAVPLLSSILVRNNPHRRDAAIVYAVSNSVLSFVSGAYALLLLAPGWIG